MHALGRGPIRKNKWVLSSSVHRLAWLPHLQRVALVHAHVACVRGHQVGAQLLHDAQPQVVLACTGCVWRWGCMDA